MKFIRLHNADDNSVVIINIENVAVIDSVTKDKRVVSRVYFTKDGDIDPFDVNETPEKIFEMINS